MKMLVLRNMYMRMKRFRVKDGSGREYLYIVKGVRGDGKPRQKVVAYLGRLDELRDGVSAISPSLGSSTSWG